MTPRSWLFIPGDSESKLAKAPGFAADALIMDLEDAVADERKGLARGMVRGFLDAHPSRADMAQLWVRVNPGEATLEDLSAIVGGKPDGIVVPKTDGPHDVVRIGHYLDALEVREALPRGSVKIVPVATETALGTLNARDFASAALPRLYGLTWGAEDLSAAVGASTNLDADGRWALTYRLARSTTLLAAKAAGVQAIETLHADFRDDAGLRRSSAEAAAEGFTGRIAIHPTQVEAINASFSPSAEAVAEAERVVAAFTASTGIGTVGLDGKMLDIPHLKRAQQVLAMHAAARR